MSSVNIVFIKLEPRFKTGTSTRFVWSVLVSAVYKFSNLYIFPRESAFASILSSSWIFLIYLCETRCFGRGFEDCMFERLNERINEFIILNSVSMKIDMGERVVNRASVKWNLILIKLVLDMLRCIIFRIFWFQGRRIFLFISPFWCVRYNSRLNKRRNNLLIFNDEIDTNERVVNKARQNEI